MAWTNKPSPPQTQCFIYLKVQGALRSLSISAALRMLAGKIKGDGRSPISFVGRSVSTFIKSQLS